MKNLFKKDGLLDNFFEISKNNTSVRTEMVAGITTFMTMAYILIVNPSILSAAGMDQGAVFTATALSALVATLIWDYMQNYHLLKHQEWDLMPFLLLQ